MQQIFFAIGHFLEWTFKVLTSMGWLPVTLITIVMFGGLFFWLALQAKYDRKAKANNTLA